MSLAWHRVVFRDEAGHEMSGRALRDAKPTTTTYELVGADELAWLGHPPAEYWRQRLHVNTSIYIVEESP